MNLETSQFFTSKGLIIGNYLSDESYKPKPTDISKFGLFDSSAPNYVSFDPSVTKEDFSPKDEDFIYPEFRLLSETTVRATFSPIDFSKNGVLKASMDLLEGTPIFPDHEPSVGNSLGIIHSLYWQEAYVLDGLQIPAGINARLKLDGKANPRIARLLLMKPPAINSTSVSVSYSWEKSHKDMDDNTFWSMFGKTGPDGELVRKVVNRIVAYPEVSLVSLGADRFAQKINDGKIVNPNKARTAFSGNHYFLQDFSKLYTSEESFSLYTNNTTMDQLSLLTAALAKLGISFDSFNWEEATPASLEALLEPLTPTEIPENIQALMASMPEVTVDEINQLRGNQITEQQIAELAELPALRERASFAESTLTSLREETIANYRASTGQDQESPVMIEMLNSAVPAQLQELNKGYIATLNALQPLICQDCGSNHIERRTSKTGGEKPTGLSAEEKIRNLRRMKASDIHGKAKAQ